MAFLRASAVDDRSLAIYGRGVMLRLPRTDDYEDWVRLRAASRGHLQPWEPKWSEDELTRASFRRRLRLYARDHDNGSGYAYFIFRSQDRALVGGLTLSNVRRGVSQSASLGYWIGMGLTGQGYMTEAVRAVVPHAFEHLDLHRLDAACLPHNQASLRVLEKVGFVREGYAQKYLKIDGRWQDHVLLGLVRHETGQEEP